MVQGIFLTCCMCGLFVAVGMAVYRNLKETAAFEMNEKYREMYKNADIRWNIDIEIIDERKRK